MEGCKAPDMGYTVNEDGSCRLEVNGHDVKCMPKIVAEAICNKYHGRGCVNISFGMAIEAMKRGKRVCRAGWNGKGMYLWLLPASEVKKEWCKDQRLIEAMGDRDAIKCLGSIRMFTADGSVLTGWLASQTDILSEDWMILADNGDSTQVAP